MTPQTWSIELKTDLSEIGRMSEWVEQFGARHELATDMVFQLNLVLEEIVTTERYPIDMTERYRENNTGLFNRL